MGYGYGIGDGGILGNWGGIRPTIGVARDGCGSGGAIDRSLAATG